MKAFNSSIRKQKPKDKGVPCESASLSSPSPAKDLPKSSHAEAKLNIEIPILRNASGAKGLIHFECVQSDRADTPVPQEVTFTAKLDALNPVDKRPLAKLSEIKEVVTADANGAQQQRSLSEDMSVCTVSPLPLVLAMHSQMPHRDLYNHSIPSQKLETSVNSLKISNEDDLAYPYNLEYADMDLMVRRGAKIGSGGFADVYTGHTTREAQAKNLWSDSTVALKFIKAVPNDAKDYQAMLRLFINEAKLMFRARYCQNVLPLYGLNQKRLLMVTPLMDGSLHDAIHGCRKSGVKIGVAAILKATRELLSAISCLHAQEIAHLDIKPANILIKKQLLAPESRRRSATACFGNASMSLDSSKVENTAPLLLYDTNYSYTVYLTDFGMAKRMSAPLKLGDKVYPAGRPASAPNQMLAGTSRPLQGFKGIGARAKSGSSIGSSTNYKASSSAEMLSALNTLFPTSDGITLIYASPEAIARFQKDIGPTRIMKDLASKLCQLQSRESKGHSASRNLNGTPMTPALFISKVIAAQDVYSFAMVLYEMLAALKPYTGERRSELSLKIVSGGLRPDVGLIKGRLDMVSAESGVSQYIAHNAVCQAQVTETALAHSALSSKTDRGVASKEFTSAKQRIATSSRAIFASEVNLLSVLNRCWAANPLDRPQAGTVLSELENPKQSRNSHLQSYSPL